MDSEKLKQFQQLDAAEIRWRDGRLSARLVFKLVLFFEGGGTVEGQLRALDTLASLGEEVGEHLTHMQTAGTDPRIVPYDAALFRNQSGRNIRTQGAADGDPGDLDLLFNGAPFATPNGGVTQWGGSVLASGPLLSVSADLSVLEFSTAISWDAREDFSRQRQRVLSAAATLRPLHGLAGLGVQFDRMMDSASDHAASIPIVKRFPGIHCGMDTQFGSEIGLRRPRADRYFSVNWLTVLCDDMLAEVGGAGALAATLGPDLPVHRYDGGAVLQAGPYPQPGDVNRGLIPAEYRAVSAATRALRFEEYKLGVLTVEPPLDGLDETLAWIRRFD
ncbi:type VI immunity family protein [Acidimangrovimonas sediminis]|uniref:type VI immunity family protein n=1 Tax=Acidimangrovimonas sediminis TaxID=2056283 RepID=UPI000C7FB194|nr:type VI immunity family protein [Acidimangrovimonas sediminis]